MQEAQKLTDRSETVTSSHAAVSSAIAQLHDQVAELQASKLDSQAALTHETATNMVTQVNHSAHLNLRASWLYG